jgi:hypothetical protein
VILVARTNKLQDLQPLVPSLQQALARLGPGEMMHQHLMENPVGTVLQFPLSLLSFSSLLLFSLFSREGEAWSGEEGRGDEGLREGAL